MSLTRINDDKLGVTFYRENLVEALRTMVRMNLVGWETTKVDRLGDGSYVVMMTLLTQGNEPAIL